ncbi:MAG: cation diffusion facilitator family transporter [Calditrichia bacterium]
MARTQVHFENKIDAKQRSSYGKIGGWASIILNFFLFVLKLALGIFSGSLALIADAFHTLSDLGTSLIVLISFRISGKPSDSEHPFGHGRAEFISAIIMSTLLAVTAVELIKSSVSRILEPEVFTAPWWIILILFLTVLLKEGLALFTMKLGNKISSATLKADSWHHHLDAISTLLVILAFLLAPLNLPVLDGVVGVLIALIILYSAYGIARNPMDHLLGAPPSHELLSKIENAALSFSEIIGVHDIIIHNYGDQMILSLHIEVDENLSLTTAHRLSEKVEQKLRESIDAYVTVHVDPVMERTPLYREVENKIMEFSRNTDEVDGFHDLRIYQKHSGLRIFFDLVAAFHLGEEASRRIEEKCKQFMKEAFPAILEISIKIEPKFSVSRRSRHN